MKNKRKKKDIIYFKELGKKSEEADFESTEIKVLSGIWSRN